MSSLRNKRILLGVTGGIAAYKSAELVRRFVTLGAEVRVAMTPAAQNFITPLTMQALSGNAVHTDLMSLDAEAAMGHIELARWADVIVVAPCTADFMSKLAVGEASDLLSTLYLASKAIKVIAPAMNQEMWAALPTQENFKTLQNRGVKTVGPASGEQACGDVGMGRMEEPEKIAQYCADLFETGELAGKTVLITAGPTREAIDPVRYISNKSSGKMGYALADAAREAGAEVILVSGPVDLPSPEGVEVLSVTTAREMHDAVMTRGAEVDIFIGAAAVADYRVAEVAEQKIKKNDGASSKIELVENPDIIRDFKAGFEKVLVAGFAAETERLADHAQSKLKKKNLDMIIANDVADERVGFDSNDNAVTVFTASGQQTFDIQSKSSLARQLIAFISQYKIG